MRLRTALCGAAAVCLAASAPAVGATTLFMEPVINRVTTLGPGQFAIPFYFPEVFPFLTAYAPGMVVTYPAGYPADPGLTSVVRIFNNTDYDITSLTFSLVGVAIEPEPFDFTITRDPAVQAFFADLDGDGRVGVSDVFPVSTLSADGRTLTLSGGVIPRGGLFTDYNLAMTSDGQPFLAAVDASFSGVAVPEPTTWAMMTLGFGLLGAGLRRRWGDATVRSRRA